MMKQVKQLRVFLLGLMLVLGGMVSKSHAFSSDVDANTSNSSDVNVELSSSGAILQGSLPTTTPSPLETQDTLTATFGVPNALLDTEFNIFNVSPAQITEWGTAYGEVWNGANAQWGGATVGLPFGRIGVFLGRPYSGIAGSIAQPVGTALAGRADASATAILTGIQNGAGGAWLGSLTNEPAPLAGHALYDTRVLAPRNMIDFLFGVSLGDNLSLGFAYAYARNKDEETWTDTRPTAATPNTLGDGSITNDRKTTDQQISLGALVKNIGPIQKLDVAFNIGLPSVDNKHSETRLLASGAQAATTASRLESDGSKIFGVLLRSIVGMGDKTKIITALTYNRPNTSSKGTFSVDSDGNGTLTNAAGDISRAWSTEDKGTNFRLDAACHQMPTDALKLIYSLSYVRSSSEREFSLSEGNSHPASPFAGAVGVREKETRQEKASGLPLGVAVEHQSFSKVSTRFGVRKVLFGNNKVEVTDITNRVAGGAFVVDQRTTRITDIDSSVAATVSLGLGIQPTKDVDIDLGLVTNLFDLDSGAGSSDIITRASVRYHF